jgi:hypothetical protein
MKRSLALATPALALALLLTGCSSDSDGANDAPGNGAATGQQAAAVTEDDVLERVAQATAEQTSVKLGLSTDGAESASGSGAIQFEPVAATMAFTGDFEGQQETVQIRLVDDAVYFSMSMLTQLTGKEWIKGTADGDDEFSQSMRPFWEELKTSADFSTSLEYLTKGTTVKEVGTETIDGVETTKFQLTADIAEAAKVATASQKELITEAKAKGLKTLTSFLWVGTENDLPVKYEQTDISDGKTSVTTVTYSGWGEPVEVEAPPASDVADVSTLFG